MESKWSHPKPNILYIKCTKQSKMKNSFENIKTKISIKDRQLRSGHKGGVLWFTGLSGSGKSTLAYGLETHLFSQNYNVIVLDGDKLRNGLNADLGFDAKSRSENIRRVAETALLFSNAGFLIITALISPYNRDRKIAKSICGKAFREIFIDASLETCEKRDPKGLYQKARSGELANFTGISDPYEAPSHPDLAVSTSNFSEDWCIDKLFTFAKNSFQLS